MVGGAFIAAALGAIATSGLPSSSGGAGAPVPDRDTAFTSTRHVTGLAVEPDGTVWAGTMGGVLHRSPDGVWQKFTRLSGLPAHEVRSIVPDEAAVVALFPRGAAAWREGQWQVAAAARRPLEPSPAEAPTRAVVWKGVSWVATLTGLHARGEKRGRTVPLPDSPGTHISALLPRGDTLWAALFGDGLWEFDGAEWRRLEIGLPLRAREITAMTSHGTTVWLGTRRDGLWEYRDRRWTQHRHAGEPYDHNCQALALYRGQLLVSTLEDGLAVRAENGWRHLTAAQLSSDAPRQMVAFGPSLYLRHGSGRVDAFDGRRWTRDVCARLPRKQAMALAADDQRLYVAQWGGWSEFDGRTWTHHLRRPELQGLPITALCPDGDRLWVGTQSRGTAEIDRSTGRLRWHDDRHGLPDDWVTTLARVGKTLCVGTFVGGLARWDGSRWTTAPELSGENVTALAPDATGGVYVGTRTGVWYHAPDGSLRSLHEAAPFLDREVQALCPAEGGLWVGTRTGLYFLKTAPEGV